VPFVVTMRNLLPIPITVGVRSPVRWTWSVDGHVEASHVDRHDPPDRRAGFEFSRGERKQFRKRRDGMFQVSDVEWEPDGGPQDGRLWVVTVGSFFSVKGPEFVCRVDLREGVKPTDT